MRPPLRDLREEAFAQARALGLSPDEAAERAGFAGEPGAGKRLDGRLDIQTRILDIRAVWDRARGADLANTIVGLLDMAGGWTPNGPGAAMREARLARVEAHRLWQAHESGEGGAPALLTPRPEEPDLSEDEWIERYGASRADLPA